MSYRPQVCDFGASASLGADSSGSTGLAGGVTAGEGTWSGAWKGRDSSVVGSDTCDSGSRTGSGTVGCVGARGGRGSSSSVEGSFDEIGCDSWGGLVCTPASTRPPRNVSGRSDSSSRSAATRAARQGRTEPGERVRALDALRLLCVDLDVRDQRVSALARFATKLPHARQAPGGPGLAHPALSASCRPGANVHCDRHELSREVNFLMLAPALMRA